MGAKAAHQQGGAESCSTPGSRSVTRSAKGRLSGIVSRAASWRCLRRFSRMPKPVQGHSRRVPPPAARLDAGEVPVNREPGAGGGLAPHRGPGRILATRVHRHLQASNITRLSRGQRVADRPATARVIEALRACTRALPPTIPPLTSARRVT
jgi:hypothetical protein